MKDAGILEGDYVVVRPQETATDGEIVVALVGEEATVKRFFRETDHVRLQPENDDDGADPLQGRRVLGQGRRALQERDMTATALQFDVSTRRPRRRPARRLARAHARALG